MTNQTKEGVRQTKAEKNMNQTKAKKKCAKPNQMNYMGRSPKRHAERFSTHTLWFIDFRQNYF